MIALDTNILVRLIAGDDHVQERAVLRLLSDREATFFLSDVTLVEMVWVLEDIYGFSREELAFALASLLNRGDLLFENETRVRHAARHHATGGDFADFLILSRAEDKGCTALASFDKRLKKLFPTFVIVPV